MELTDHTGKNEEDKNKIMKFPNFLFCTWIGSFSEMRKAVTEKDLEEKPMDSILEIFSLRCFKDI